MPNTGALIGEGVFRQMESSIPEVSSVAWSSIITGTNPGEHGIFGFTDFAPGTYRVIFPNFADLKTSPFWKREGSGKSVIINVPFTYPAGRLNGILIAGFVALDLQRATYPSTLVPQLEKMGYRVDVDSQRAHQSMDFFLKDLDKTLQARISVYRHLWNEEWDTFVLVFTGTDRLAHFLWDAYEDASHKYHSTFLDHFCQIDKVIGEIAQRIREEDVLILLSDHGFESLNKDVYVNFVLKEQGFLKLGKDSPGSLRDVEDDTRAFALDPARIYVNAKGQFSRGSVGPEDREAVVQDLEDVFEGLHVDGERVVKRACRKEEIFAGPSLHRAPDLVLLANEGFNLKASIKAKELWGKGIFTGKHSQSDAFLLIRGDFDREIVPEKPHVSDVVGIMDKITRRSSR